MKLSITTELDYHVPEPADLLLQLEAAIIPEQIIEHAFIELPKVEHFARVQGSDLVGDRIWLRMQGDLKVRYEATVDVQRITADVSSLASTPPHMLPGETVDYMLPSLYCPSESFQPIIGKMFGHLSGGAKVAAIRDWVQDNIAYVRGCSDETTNGMDTYKAKEGVCRDFAHLMISMVRACAIPARFASVYGIGVEPQDFHAVCEVFLGDTWYMIDPTGMSSADRMAKIGIGRDAADVSFLTSYGETEMRSQSVKVDLVTA
jgi:transglutaminase-like putative cysteine protease